MPAPISFWGLSSAKPGMNVRFGVGRGLLRWRSKEFAQRRRDRRGKRTQGASFRPDGSGFLFRTKTQRHEDVVLAAKRLSPFTLHRIAAKMERRPCGREPASSCLCVFVRNEFGRRPRHGASFPACAHLCDLCANPIPAFRQTAAIGRMQPSQPAPRKCRHPRASRSKISTPVTGVTSPSHRAGYAVLATRSSSPIRD